MFASYNVQACSDRALVLHARDIPYQVGRDAGRSVLLVPAGDAERAKFEIWQYDQENRQARRRPRATVDEYHNGLPGIFVYILVLCVTGWLAGERAFNQDWLSAGRVDGDAIRNGEWWRTLTALTLHSGVGHLLGNLGFGALFGGLAARLIGNGIAWLAIVLAAGAANALNTILLESSHRSIGASTAVFAALGLLGGFVWRARLMEQERWPYRLGPLVGALALLAYTGTGDAATDIGAHLSGFLCGCGAGILLTFGTRYLVNRRLQIVCGSAALALILLAWVTAFGST
ncbi:MAG: rhomboid family intramembrane serine protease [Planctomycetaceae bacterium]